MSILEICRFLQEMDGATALRESQYMFPIVEGAHLLGLALMMAPVLMFDLRLLGVLWKSEPATAIRNQFLPVTFAGAFLMVVTGTLLFWSEALKCYNSPYFRIKVILLCLTVVNAGIFHSTIDRKITEWESDPNPPGRAKLAGIASILLWTGVIFAGRYTAYTI